MVTDPVKWEIVLAKSGVVLTGKKNGKRVSLRVLSALNNTRLYKYIEGVIQI